VAAFAEGITVIIFDVLDESGPITLKALTD
jgi:hypothetical protein